MDKQIKIGILGTADIARRYSIKAFQSIPDATVSVIGSRDPSKALKMAKDFGVERTASYEEVLNDLSIDAVYVPLPSGLHEEWILKALKSGKHVICEKSITPDLKGAKAVIESARSSGLALYENFACGFHPQHDKVLSLIKSGEIGEPHIFKGYFGFPKRSDRDFRYDKNLGGGCLNDAGAYTVFMARKIYGSEPVALTASLEYDKARDIDIRGGAILEFDNGRRGLLGFDFDAVYQNNYSIWGSRGTVTVSRAYSIPPDMKPQISVMKNDDSKDTITAIDLEAANQFKLIFEDFCDTVLGNDAAKREVMYKNIINQAKALEAMRISGREDRRVLLSEMC